MDASSSSAFPLAGAAKRLLHRVLAVGENRFQLLVVELQEERDRLLDVVLLAVATAAAGMLCAIAWSAALVILLWHFGFGPLIILLVLGAVYGISAVVLCRRLEALRRQQQTLAASLDQLQKDRACLEKS
jgi:uncharacterized membrane protein YqjE